MRSISPTLVAAGFVAALALGCASDDDDGVTTINAAPLVSGVVVIDARESPAQVTFVLTDEESDPAEAELVFFPPGAGTAQPMTLVGSPDLSMLATAPEDQVNPPGGVEHTFQWDFAADVGTSFTPGVQVRVDLMGAQSIVSSASSSLFAVGNDAPTIALGSAGGTGPVFQLDFSVADSSNDPVNIAVEYDVVGDNPDAGFQLARPDGLAPGDATPAFAFMNVAATDIGVPLTFDWDSEFDEPTSDFDAVLRLTAQDDLVTGNSQEFAPFLVDNNESAMIALLSVADGRESPATVTFTLTDTEDDPQAVDLFFLRPGSGTREPMTTVQATTTLGANPGGTQHVVEWDFATDLGSTGYMTGFTAEGDVREGSNVVSTVTAPTFVLGNDAPVVDPTVATPIGEVSGDADVTIRVSDSSGDPVNVAVEYDIVGDSPDAGFQLARPAGLAPGDPTPAFAFTNVIASPTGVDLDFTWDVLFDEGTTDFDAVLRFTPSDDLVAGLGVPSPLLALDNNQEPRADVDPDFVANTDQLRGIPVSFAVSDPEADTVEVFVQWRLASGAFPTLPSDPDDLRAALADPAARRALQIASEYRPLFSGRVEAVPAGSNPNGDLVRLPELGGSAAGALALGPEGLDLSILRPGGPPVASGNPWSLTAPVSALPIGSGSELLVLDEPSVGTWRLRRMDASTGTELELVATGTDGTPSVMDRGLGGAPSVVFGAGDGTGWVLLEVELDGGAVTELVSLAANPTTGQVRGVATIDSVRTVLTVGTSLVLAEGGAAEVLLDDFVTPWGVVPDPTTANGLFVAERGNPAGVLSTGATYRVDLTTLQRTEVSGGRVRPRAIALSADGTALLALGDLVPVDAAFELLRLDLAGGGTLEVAGLLTDERGGIAVANGGIVHPLADQDDIALSGGVQQRRRIVGYDPLQQVVTVDAPLAPTPVTGQTWELRDAMQAKATSASGALGRFVWDSTDVAQGEDVVVRAVAFDTDVGTTGLDTQTPRPVSAPIDVPAEVVVSGVGMQPVALAIADLNDDGLVDAVTANAGGEDLGLLLQVAPGAFTAGTPLAMPLGSTPSDVLTADINGDEMFDVVAADGAGGVRIYFQSGGGGFGNPTDLPGGGTSAIAVGDLNRDGRVDLLAGGATSVSVRFNTPSRFDALPDAELTSLVDDVRAIAMADLVGDGELDVVVANGGNGSVLVFEGPDFTAPPLELLAPTVGSEARALALGDLTSDGLADVAVAYAGTDELAIFASDGSGGFLTPLSLGDATSTAEPRGLRAADLDADGDLDLALAKASGAGLAVFFQTAPGVFAATPDVEQGVVGATLGVSDVVVTDVDADGRVDLAAVSEDTGELSLLVPARPGDFRSQKLLLSDPNVDEAATLVEPGDFDGDGDLDLALANRLEDHITIWYQTAPGEFTPGPGGPIAPGVLNSPTGLASGDLDGDGDLDLVAAQPGASSVAILLQGPPGVFSASAFVGSTLTTFRPRAVAVGDVDGDRDLDIVTANTGGGSVSVFLQLAPGVFPMVPSFSFGGNVTIEPNSVLLRDIDGDGDADILTADRGLKQSGKFSGVAVFLQAPSGAFPQTPSQGLSEFLPTTRVNDAAIGDLDADGDLDIVYADEGSGKLVIFMQDANGVFQPGPSLVDALAAIAPVWVEVADVDNDGQDDVIAVDAIQSRALVWIQTSPGSFRQERFADLTPLAPGAVTVSVRAADLDGDGDTDLVTADSVGGAQTIHFGGR